MTSPAERDVAAVIEELFLTLDPPVVEDLGRRDVDLISAGQMDSMAVVLLVEHIEQTYGIWVPDEALTRENLATINTIAHLVVDLGSAERALQ